MEKSREVDPDEPQGHEYSATFRVFSSTLRLADLTARLGEPTDSHDIGDPVSPRNPGAGVRRHSYWGLSPADNRRAGMEDLIDELLSFAETHEGALTDLGPETEIDIFCGIFAADAQGGFQLSPDLMRRAAGQELRIGFDIYCTAE